MSRVSLSTAGVLNLTTMLLAIGCGQETTGPADPGQILLTYVSGTGQSGVVGTR